MKKLLLLAMSLVSLSVFAAEDPFADLEKLIGEGNTGHNAANKVLDQATNDKWKYAAAEKIESTNIMNDGFTVKTTEILYNGASVEKYRVYYAESSLSTITDTSKIKDIILTATEKKDNMVSLKLTGLKENTTYFVVVSPVDPTNPSAEALSMISDEISVKTTAPTAAAPATAAAGLENVSYTYKDNTVTLTWSPLANNSNVDVQVRHQSETAYKKVGTAKGSAGKLSFDVTKSGNYFLKMSATDGNGAVIGKEHIQTVKVDSVNAPAADKPIVQTAPKVGPASNLLYGVAFFALLFYVVYRFRRIEA
jgi:hypothetical protein